ncbi:MAG: hypothetical protein GF364_20535 [Candidatus Lokiarchaeota archaeon]|nr:hypothetical protein [Candidatus Lokiarchaeota archaeon]
MYKYIFILGSNWHLSLAEINEVLKRDEYKGQITDYSACVAIVQFNRGEISEYNIAELQFMLGGTQKICKMVEFIDYNTFTEAFPPDISGEVHPGVMIDARRTVKEYLSDCSYYIFVRIDKKGKYFVANSVYPVEFSSDYYKILTNHFLQFANKFWVQYLKEKGAKNAIYYRYPEDKIKNGTLNPIFPHHFMKYELFLPTKKEIVYTLTEEGMYIGYVLNVSNSNEMKMIDEERPFIFKEALIPPKFAKMMINFVNLKKPFHSTKLLDPFCGSGTILIFAYILGIKVYGADKDSKMVDGTRKNLKWVKQYLEKPTKVDFKSSIVNCEVADLLDRFSNTKFNGIVTEPILLPFFRTLPKYNKIKEHIDENVIPNYEHLFRISKDLLKEKGRICVVAPAIDTLDGGKIRIGLNKIAENYGFRYYSLLDTKEIPEKSNKNLRLQTRNDRLFDVHSKYLDREFYIFYKT